MIPQVSVDRAQTAAFIEALLKHAGADAGRFILAGIAEGLSPKIRRFQLDDVAEALDLTRQWNAEGRNVYWGTALMHPDLPPGARGKKEDITAMLGIVVDLDTPEAAARYERADFPLGLRPTFAIRTSRTPKARYQLVYLFHEPETDRAAWERAARALEVAWGADHCSKNPVHVWRLPGTINWPDAKKRAAGRVAEPAVLVHAEEACRYDLSDFDDLLDALEASPAFPEVLVEGSDVQTQQWDSLGEILWPLDGDAQQRVLDDVAPKKADGTPDRSKFDYQIAMDCIRAGLSRGDYIALYVHAANEGYRFPDKALERERRKAGAGLLYLQRTYDRALTVFTQTQHAVSIARSRAPVEAEPPPLTRRIRFQTVPELARRPRREPLIENVLLERTFACVYGPSGCGKSWLLVDLACHIATGKPWHGQHVNQGSVAVIAAEGGDGLLDRIRGWFTHHGLNIDNAPILVWDEPVDLLAKNGRACDVDELIEALREDFEAHGWPPPAVVFIDTLAQSMGGGNENDAQDMNAFITACNRIRAQMKTTVFAVHHTGKDQDKGERGHSSLRAALDTSIKVSGSDGRIAAQLTKQKDGPTEGRFDFSFESVAFVDEITGEVVETRVLVHSAGKHLHRAAVGELTDRQQKVLDVLVEAGANGLSNAEWQKLSHAAGVKSRTTFGEARKRLTETGYVHEQNGRFFAQPPGECPMSNERPILSN